MTLGLGLGLKEFIGGFCLSTGIAYYNLDAGRNLFTLEDSTVLVITLVVVVSPLPILLIRYLPSGPY